MSDGWRRYLPWARKTQGVRTVAVEASDPDSIDHGTCPHCGLVAPRPAVADHPWAAFAGYGACIAFPDGTPAPGEVVTLDLAHPFRGRLGDEVWTMTTRPDPDPSPPKGDPGDLAALRFVRCRFVSQQAGRVAAEILSVLRPEDLLDLPLGQGNLGALAGELPGDAQTNETRSCGPLRVIRWSRFYGEAIDWILLWHGEAETHLLAHATSSTHRDEIALGNRSLAPAERAAVVERAARCRPVERFGLDDDAP